MDAQITEKNIKHAAGSSGGQYTTDTDGEYTVVGARGSKEWWEPEHLDKSGLSDETADQVDKKVKTQITKDESKTPCYCCGR